MIAQKLTIANAVALELRKLGVSFVTQYDISRIAWRLYQEKSYNGRPLSISRSSLNRSSLRNVEMGLHDNGFLKPLRNFPNRSVYALIGANIEDSNAIVCSVDPFCYLSHLSAMELYNLTDRIPEKIYISVPDPNERRSLAKEKMERDFGVEELLEYRRSKLPLLVKIKMEKIGKRHVYSHQSKYRGAFRKIKDTPVRVSTIGRTFLDMLKEPTLCGGVSHIVRSFKENAKNYKDILINEIDRDGLNIDKIRAGYILDEICDISDPRIDGWASLARRGGSSKLDPSAEYEHTFSERWKLSINAVLPQE